MEKISLIIPVYNGERYLRQCVESALKQDYPNLEIIIINDGSKDKTPIICEEFALKDERIKVFHKKVNEGVGAGRNTGLELASGDYIIFLDSDDWIDANHVSDLYQLLKRSDADTAICNFTQYNENEGRFKLHISEADYYEAVSTPQEWFKFQYGHGYNLSLCFTVPWGKLYKKSVFENVLYPIDGFGEDDCTTWKTYLNAKKIAYMPKSSLLYRVNSDLMNQVANHATIFNYEPVLERIQVLGLLGWDLSREVAAFEWRANASKQALLEQGKIKEYKQLIYQLNLMEKVKKK